MIPRGLHRELTEERSRQQQELDDAERSGDRPGVERARCRLDTIVLALDEAADAEERVGAAVLALAHRRGPTRSICPSDAARAVGGEAWRDLMDPARAAAAALARRGAVEVTQGGRVIDPDRPWRGPVRVRVVPQ